jgi:3-hydroxyacyl-CoA dehydrogenase
MPRRHGARCAVAGKNGIATLEMMLVNMKEGGMISAHDYQVACSAAVALCGGEVETAAGR